MKTLKLILLFALVFQVSNANAELGPIPESIPTAEVVQGTNSKSLNIHYVGSSTEGYVAIGSGAMTGYAPFGLDNQDFNFALSTTAYNTMGKICSTVNALSDWDCVLLGGKKDDDSILIRDKEVAFKASTADAKQVGGWEVGFDTGPLHVDGIAEGSAISGFSLRIGIWPTGNPFDTDISKSIVLDKCVFKSSGTGTARIYGKLKKYAGIFTPSRDDTTLVWELDSNSMTGATATWTNGLAFAKGEHVVISAGNASVEQGVHHTQAGQTRLSCDWREVE